ncbi:MAG TPA: TetR/AcrR family transcriptional regulator C-terminal domain-containing protein [Myxococcaceae bacterium]|nr:TetR/AcrR family transcriptional regulator C-terminal domain-containing protein [Myxococcaceae bacterium]
MPSHRSSAGDATRTLELLWRRSETGLVQRGPRPSLTVDTVVAKAIAVADAEGLETLTVRRVAQALGTAPMSLYTYVPSKAELLDLMLDTVYAQMARTHPRETHWRARLAAVAEDNRVLYERHPWVSSVSTRRPPLGPGLMEKYEYELRPLEGLGLDDVEMDAALSFVLGFVDACARTAADVRAAQQETAMSDPQWWAANAPLLARVFDVAKYPLAARVGTAAGKAHEGAHGAVHAFDFGLRRVLDGLALLVDARAKEAPGRQGRRR